MGASFPLWYILELRQKKRRAGYRGGAARNAASISDFGAEKIIVKIVLRGTQYSMVVRNPVRDSLHAARFSVLSFGYLLCGTVMLRPLVLTQLSA